jgi:response regulator RpfG family c-di-GMP phosphodiesterase
MTASNSLAPYEIARKVEVMEQISRSILCVDDEPNVLEGLKRQLRRQDVTTAIGPVAGLDAVKQQGPFALVISDYRMPEMTGAEFLRQVRQISPETVTIMLTGCADLDVAVSALHDGRIFRFLSKPASREALDAAVRDGLEQYRLVVSQRLMTAALNVANDSLQTLNEELEQRVEDRTRTIARLHGFVSELSRLDCVQRVAELVVRTASEMLDSQRVSLMLPDPSGEYLTIAAASGIDPEVASRIRVPVGAMVAGRVFEQASSIVVNEPQPDFLPSTRYDSEFFAVVPLISSALVTSGHSVGVINVTESKDAAPYSDSDVATLKTIAESAAVALQNQIRLQQRNEARDAIILAMAKLAENRDPETGAHLERVQVYCRMLSETLAQTPKYATQIDDEFIWAIFRSAPLHDIGKVGIPDHILLKAGRLTPQEFEVMKTHTTIGGSTIRSLVQRGRGQKLLEMGMEIAQCHHERFDGRGYPAGLKGEEIPLPARILALADVYDALTSKRVYKPAMSHEESAAIIREDSGRHFDPDVVDAFLQREADYARTAIELIDAPEVAEKAAQDEVLVDSEIAMAQPVV